MAEEREEPMAESEDTPDVEGHVADRVADRTAESADHVDVADAPDVEAHIADRVSETTEYTE
jgi:hypothetical protein